MKVDFLFVLLHVSFLLSIMLFFFIHRMKNKTQLHYSFLVLIILLCLWTLGHIIELYIKMINTTYSNNLIYYYNFFQIFIPTLILTTGIIYTKTKVDIQKLTYFLIFPVLDYLMLVTNRYHHMYFVSFASYNNLVEYGPFFIVHTIGSYIYILIGLVLLIYSSIKNSGFFSMQSWLVIIGVIVPLTVNVLLTLKVILLPIYSTTITFSFAILLFTIAIFRYSFLKISPIALRTIIDKISDCFIVVSEDNYIIDYNKTMGAMFSNLVSINRNMHIQQVFMNTNLMEGDNNIINLIDMAKTSTTPVVLEKHIKQDNFDRHFSIEITPIVSNKNHLGTIILFRDITENIKNLAAIEEKHAILMEQERLASLGQLIGGIAHNLKTPIMSISGAVEGLKDLVYEYEQSADDETVTAEDHREIAEEMRTWLKKIQPYCAYMSDIIDTVKGQAMSLSNTTMISFSVYELVKRIELLLKYELIRFNCTLNTEVKVNSSTELYGDINSLVQVFDNIIINAIQAYEGKNGKIEFTIEESNDSILFTVKDYAKGIPHRVKDKLLKEMVTTKGTAGTGLGLYMSYSTIKGRFEGKMWFESTEGKGTTFYIQLPRKK